MRNFIFIFVILLFAGCTKSGENIDIEQKYNIYISKLSDEEIEENLKNGDLQMFLQKKIRNMCF